MKKALLIATGLMMFTAAGCGNQESNEKINSTSAKKETVSQKKANEENQEISPKVMVHFQNKEQYQSFEAAAKDNNYKFKLLKKEEGSNQYTYSTITYYPNENFEYDSVTKYIQQNGLLMAVDGYSNYTFLDKNESFNKENYFEVTAQEQKFIEQLISQETTGNIPGGLRPVDEQLDLYKPTEKNFKSHEEVQKIYNSVIAGFHSVYEARNEYFNTLLRNHTEGSSGFIKESDVENNIKLADSVYKDKKDLEWLKVKAGNDQPLYNEYNALEYIINLKKTIKDTKEQIDDINNLKETLRPMVNFYEKFKDYKKEESDGPLVDENSLNELEKGYETFLKELNEELSKKEKIQNKIEESNFGFLVQK
ncbi:hypothetical protein AAGG74_15485 [Bacillus mexicanus]|uniref:hypothetical protein n=1 Tax=Bacillus mexicanus TaxID=2834415 RepID=UPI003D24202A